MAALNPFSRSSRWLAFPASVVLSLACALTAPAASAAKAKAQPSHPDFSGMWVVADIDLVVRPDLTNPSYTPEAKAKLDFFKANANPKKGDDQGAFCSQGGMPWTVTTRAAVPLEILQTDKRITMLFEVFNSRRSIYLDRTEKPKAVTPHSEGFSIGHWEGSTLVIETTGLKPSSDFSSRLRSDQARIVERWNIVQDPKHGKTIVIDLLFEDPKIFKEPTKGRQIFKQAPPDTWLADYGCTDGLWDAHVEKRMKEIAAEKASK